MHESWMKVATLIPREESPYRRRAGANPRRAGVQRAAAEADARVNTRAGSETASPRTSFVARPDAPGAQLVGERAHRFHFLDAHAVDYLEADGNYVTIHVGDDRFLTRTTLKHLAAALASNDFVRIDRSLLVNLRQIDYVERLESGRFAFKLRHGQLLTSSRERASGIIQLLRTVVR